MKQVNSNWKYWLAAFLLLAPLFMLYIGHYLQSYNDPNLIPTGFLGKRDSPYYMALAREYFDRGKWSLFYPLPMSDNFNNEAIYFQIHILFLGIVWTLTGLPPGIVFDIFGILAGTVCIFTLIKLFKSMYGLETVSKKLTFILLVWGGGILSISGFLYSFLTKKSLKEGVLKMFVFDPDKGWWGLNFGRNLIYPTEAYYHALAVGIIYLVYKKNWNWVLVLTLILSLSSPHTGFTYLAILLTYSFLERFYFKNKEVSLKFIGGLSAILVYHIGYYLAYLNRNAEHRDIISTHWVNSAEEGGTNFMYDAINFVPGYFLITIMVCWLFRQPKLIVPIFKKSFNRFLFLMFAIVFLLANHEFAFKPQQPLHFEKGYVYLSLFLLSAGVLIKLFDNLNSKFSRMTSGILTTLICILFLSDNLSFFTYFSIDNYRGSGGLQLFKQQKEVLDVLNKEGKNDYLIVSDDEMISYWAMVYTPMRSLVSHEVTTPFIAEKRKMIDDLFLNGKIDANLKDRKLLIIDSQKRKPGINLCDSIPCNPLFENKLYKISTIN